MIYGTTEVILDGELFTVLNVNWSHDQGVWRVCGTAESGLDVYRVGGINRERVLAACRAAQLED